MDAITAGPFDDRRVVGFGIRRIEQRRDPAGIGARGLSVGWSWKCLFLRIYSRVLFSSPLMMNISAVIFVAAI